MEIDSMAAVHATNWQTGTIPAPPVYNQQTGKAMIPLEELEEEFAGTDQHRVGRIDISGYPDPFNTDQTVVGGQDWVRILNAPANIATAIGASYTLWDDDAGNDLNLEPPFHMVGFDAPPVSLPKPPDTSLMPIVYAGAYVLPVLADPDTYQPDSPFDFQVKSGEERATGNENQNVASTEPHWAVHITSAFQGWINKDSDPDGEEAQYGLQYGMTATSPFGWWVAGSLIYVETIRDKTRANPNSTQTLERYTVVHESGHQFLLEHADGHWPPGDDEDPADDFIMTDVTNPSGMAPNVKFSPTSRRKIRGADRPRLPEPES